MESWDFLISYLHILSSNLFQQKWPSKSPALYVPTTHGEATIMGSALPKVNVRVDKVETAWATVRRFSLGLVQPFTFSPGPSGCGRD